MGLLTFVIPTRGRHRQLSTAVRSIAEQIEDADARIVVIFNEGETDTIRAIERMKAKWPFISSIGVPGNPDYSDKFRAMMRAAPDPEWVWTFGDDDVLRPGALKFMLPRLKSADSELSFIHVSERKRASGTKHTYSGRLIDLCCTIGWIEMTGFISGNITRGEMLNQCADVAEWGLYARSAFVHSAAILNTLMKAQAQFIDLPLIDAQDDEQTEETMAFWSEANTAQRYFYLAQCIESMMERGLIKKKLPPKFFRYMNYHLWDRHITYFISSWLRNRQQWHGEWAEHVRKLAELINDEEMASSILQDVDDAVEDVSIHSESSCKLAEARLQNLYRKRSQSVYPYFFTNGNDLEKVAA